MKTFLLSLVLIVLSVGCDRPVSSSSGMNVGSNVIQVDITANSNCVKSGESVKLRATATNRGSTVAVIQLRDKPVLDIEIRYFVGIASEPEEHVERWSSGKELSTELTQLELKSGESKTIEMGWVALPLRGSLPAVDVNGLLRYGEGSDEVATAHTVFSVDRCP